MKLSKATNENHHMINELLSIGNNNNEMGYGYPRGDIEDVENELKEYGLNINDCFYMIKEEKNIIGIIGFLELENDKAMMIGPVMYPNFYIFEKVNESIGILLNKLDSKYSRISCDILKENVILTKVLECKNFKLSSSHIAMKAHLNENLVKDDKIFKSITPVYLQDKSRLIEINNLFGNTLSEWANEGIESLDDYYEEGYRLAAVVESNRIIGAINWIWFEKLGYGRIEYLAIQKTYQGKGYGGILIDYVLSELSKGLNYSLHNYFHLDFNMENENAYKLYLKKGFEIQYQDNVYIFHNSKEILAE